jgi:capsular exopolysaccharide synthesis family protein
MSRIHEALKKAEQERALSQPTRETAPSVLDAGPSVLDVPLAPAGVFTSAATMVAPSPALSSAPESLLTRCRQTNWTPDPKTMLFFSGEEHAPGMEEFRTLRSRLYQAREKQPLSKLLVTSALPKEGKSFTASNLAQVIVRQHGRRVLLLDADLRNPQLHNCLGAEPGPGLSEYLRSETDEFSVIQRGPMENLFLIPAGRNSGNPAELLANGRLKFLLSRLETMFDWIIVDSAPAVPVADAALLANFCDGVLLGVRSNSTPIDAARKARKEFADRNVVGVVLNGINPELSPYASYYYAAYGSEPKAEAKN